MPVSVTYFSDPGCPWAYSVNPALAVLRWRYGSQLEWRLVTIGLSEDVSQYVARGYTPAMVAQGYRRFRRLGMPFTSDVRPRLAATSRACRAIVATRLADPAREYAVFRALQIAQFTTKLLLDDDDDLAAALARVPDLDAGAIVASIDDPEVVRAYEADRAEARTAAGSPTEFQGKARASDGPVRYTAPSLIFEHGGRRLEAGGYQTIEAYDVLIANLDPTLARAAPADGPAPLLERFPDGLVTQEIAAALARGNDVPDRDAAESALIDLVADGGAQRTTLGDDALWQAVAVREPAAPA